MVGQSVSLNSLTFSVVGPGKVGASLAHWLEVQGGRLKLVGHRSRGPAQDLVRGLGGRPIPIGEISTVEEDLCLIAVPDESLGDVAALLAERPQAGVVLHTSGRAPAEILAPLRRTGSAIGSFHPLKAFPQVIADPREARSLVFGIDGDEKALLLARRLASALSASACEIPAAVRSHYHLAATMAAGGLVTLLASAAELAARVGLGDEVVAGYLSLAQGALDRAAGSDSIAEAITGPVARGDHEGFAQQIDKVRSLDPALADLLELLAKRTRHHCRDL